MSHSGCSCWTECNITAEPPGYKWFQWRTKDKGAFFSSSQSPPLHTQTHEVPWISTNEHNELACPPEDIKECAEPQEDNLDMLITVENDSSNPEAHSSSVLLPAGRPELGVKARGELPLWAVI